jgi:hypothetical protein
MAHHGSDNADTDRKSFCGVKRRGRGEDGAREE